MVSLLLIASACGDPLVGDAFLGTPRFAIGGAVVQTTPRAPEERGDLLLSLFWIGVDEAARPTIVTEQAARLDAGFAEFRMTMFDDPPPDATTFSDLHPDGRLGLALIALYEDVDGDRTLDLANDRLVGATAQHLIGFASAPIAESSRAHALVGSIGAGYHLFEVDVESRCRFVSRDTCEAEGTLFEEPPDTSAPLTLWDQPDEVLVPAPKLDPMTSVPISIWVPR